MLAHEADDVAGVRRDFGLDENDVEHRLNHQCAVSLGVRSATKVVTRARAGRLSVRGERVERGAGGHHVVDDADVAAAQRRAPAQLNARAHVARRVGEGGSADCGARVKHAQHKPQRRAMPSARASGRAICHAWLKPRSASRWPRERHRHDTSGQRCTTASCAQRRVQTALGEHGASASCAPKFGSSASGSSGGEVVGGRKDRDRTRGGSPCRQRRSACYGAARRRQRQARSGQRRRRVPNSAWRAGRTPRPATQRAAQRAAEPGSAAARSAALQRRRSRPNGRGMCARTAGTSNVHCARIISMPFMQMTGRPSILPLFASRPPCPQLRSIWPTGLDRAGVFSPAPPHSTTSGFLPREIAGRMRERLDYIKVAPPRVLDAGCGAGADLPGLRERFAEAPVLGVDISPAMLARASPAAAARRRAGCAALSSRHARQGLGARGPNSRRPISRPAVRGRKRSN